MAARLSWQYPEYFLLVAEATGDAAFLLGFLGLYCLFSFYQSSIRTFAQTLFRSEPPPEPPPPPPPPPPRPSWSFWRASFWHRDSLAIEMQARDRHPWQRLDEEPDSAMDAAIRQEGLAAVADAFAAALFTREGFAATAIATAAVAAGSTDPSTHPLAGIAEAVASSACAAGIAMVLGLVARRGIIRGGEYCVIGPAASPRRW